MMRKVVSLGKSCLVVSLPVKWTRKYDVQKGDELELEPEQNILKVGISKIKRLPKSAAINITGMSQMMAMNSLRAFYKSGYEEIQISFSARQDIKAISDEISRVLPGFEVISAQENSFTVRAISDEQPEQLDQLLNRIFMVNLTIMDSIISTGTKPHQLTGIQVMETTVNKLTNLCERMVNRSSLIREELKSFYYLLAWNLERLADALVELPLDSAKNKSFNGILSQARASFHKLYAGLSDLDSAKIAEYSDEVKALLENVKSNKSGLCSLAEVLKRMQDFSTCSIAIIVNKNLPASK